MPSGFIMVVRTISDPEAVKNEEYIDERVSQLMTLEEFHNVDLETLNYALYKCDEEERDYTEGVRGVFHIDGVPMVYAGIASVIHLIRSLKETQQLGNPLFNNIRQGNWLMDYILQRFKNNKETLFVVELLEDIFEKVKKLPNRSKPHYFSKAMCFLWDRFILGQLKHLDHHNYRWITQDPFTVHLFESISQFYGRVKSVKFEEYEDSL